MQMIAAFSRIIKLHAFSTPCLFLPCLVGCVKLATNGAPRLLVRPDQPIVRVNQVLCCLIRFESAAVHFGEIPQCFSLTKENYIDNRQRSTLGAETMMGMRR